MKNEKILIQEYEHCNRKTKALEGDGMGGNLVWLNDEWAEVEPGNKHIKHLACEYRED